LKTIKPQSEQTRMLQEEELADGIRRRPVPCDLCARRGRSCIDKDGRACLPCKERRVACSHVAKPRKDITVGTPESDPQVPDTRTPHFQEGSRTAKTSRERKRTFRFNHVQQCAAGAAITTFSFKKTSHSVYTSRERTCRSPVYSSRPAPLTKPRPPALFGPPPAHYLYDAPDKSDRGAA